MFFCEECCSTNKSGYNQIKEYPEKTFNKYRNGEKWFETPLILSFFFMIKHFYHNQNVIVYHNPYPQLPYPNTSDDISKKESIIMFVHKKSHYVFLQLFLKKKVVEVYNCKDLKLSVFKSNIMRCLKDHNPAAPDSRPADFLVYDGLSVDKWYVKGKKCIRQNDFHSCGVITCLLAWNILSNNEFEFTNDWARGREIVMDKYLELNPMKCCLKIQNLLTFPS